MAGPASVRATVAIKSTSSDDGTVRLYGWGAMSRDDLGEPVIDAHGEYIPIEELERAVQRAFVSRGGKGSAGVQHESFGRADLIESFVLTHEKRAGFELGKGPLGWMVGLESKDPDVAKAVRSGQLMELSLHGFGRRDTVSIPHGQEAGSVLKSDEGGRRVGVIRDLELSDVELLSIVDRGASANERVRSRVVLVKRTVEGHPMPKTATKKGRTPQMILAELFETGKLADLAPEDKESLLALAGGAPAPAPAKEPAPMESAEDDDEPEKAEGEMDEQEKAAMAKRDEEVQSLEKRNQELEARLIELEKASKRSGIVEMVKSEMPYLPGVSVDETADLIQEMQLNLGEETVKRAIELMKASSEVAKNSDLFKTAGIRKGGGSLDEDDPSSALLEIAKGLRAKDPKLSRHESIVAAGKERPDLWRKRQAVQV